MSLRNPLMPACFVHWTEPGAAGAEDVLRMMTWRRTLTLRGHAFQAFERDVLPLLDGAHTIDQICDAVADVFSAQDVIACIDMLAAQGLVVEGADNIAQSTKNTMAPQLGWLSENAPEGRAAQNRLGTAHVVLFGVGGCGAALARSLIASGIATLTLVDPSEVQATDSYFSALFRAEHIGDNRAQVLRDSLTSEHTDTQVACHTQRPRTSEDIRALIQGASLVLCCLESGELNLALLLNEACHSLRIPWIAASLEGTELVVGPGFFNTEGGPCYQCWRMRELAAAPNLTTRYAAESELARRQTDLSDRRENLAGSADIVGGMIAAEVVTWLSASSPPNLDGRFITLTLPGLRMDKHTVLRKPGCPVCSPIPAPQA